MSHRLGQHKPVFIQVSLLVFFGSHRVSKAVKRTGSLFDVSSRWQTEDASGIVVL